MSFPIDLMATAPTPTQDQIEQTAGTILRGGAGDPFGRMTKPDGGVFDFDDGTIWVQRLSPDTCDAVFKAARATDTFLNVGVGDYAPMQIKGSRAKPPRVFGKAVLISNPAALCSTLRKDMSRRPVVKPDPYDDYVSTDDLSARPPPEPGAEPRLTHDPSGVAAQCETETRNEMAGAHWAVNRTLVSQNPTWGVVWRADLWPDHVKLGMRIVCWRNRATGKLARSKQPLEAWGPFPALAPLSGQGVATK